eukprot:1242067-Pleurochrysis_carterae.AAC.1
MCEAVAATEPTRAQSTTSPRPAAPPRDRRGGTPAESISSAKKSRDHGEIEHGGHGNVDERRLQSARPQPLNKDSNPLRSLTAPTSTAKDALKCVCPA